MLNGFKVLGWLNAVDTSPHLNGEASQLIKKACAYGLSSSEVRLILERLRHAGHSSGDSREKAEILLYCAVIGHWRGWCPQAAVDATEAVLLYDDDDHRRATALWILGMTQWDLSEPHDAYRNWSDAKKIFEQRKILFQHFAREKDWYQNQIRQIQVDLVFHPEETWTWLNWFERSCLRSTAQQIVDHVQEKIQQHAYSSVYALMHELQQAERACDSVLEKAEIYLEFGLAIYELGNAHFAVDLLRKAVSNFYPGIGAYHKQTVARCMLGALEWKIDRSHTQAVADWNRSIEEFEILRQWASRDHHQTKIDWYTEHRAILCEALSDRLHGPATKPPEESQPDGHASHEGGLPQAPSTPDVKQADLYQELLGKVLWDRATADRLIEFERKKSPSADRNELIKRAIERWVRDNR